MGILGLLPAAVKTDEEEIARCKANLDRLTDVLDKYIYLANLQVRDLFHNINSLLETDSNL